MSCGLLQSRWVNSPPWLNYFDVVHFKTCPHLIFAIAWSKSTIFTNQYTTYNIIDFEQLHACMNLTLFQLKFYLKDILQVSVISKKNWAHVAIFTPVRLYHHVKLHGSQFQTPFKNGPHNIQIRVNQLLWLWMFLQLYVICVSCDLNVLVLVI